MTMEIRWNRILKHEPVPILFVGDSHVGRLYNWFSGQNPDGIPNFGEFKVLALSRFSYSGGALWYNLLDRLYGINLPEWQHQGDTLSPIINDLLFAPQYGYLICGSNSCDWLNDRFYDKMKDSVYSVSLVTSPYVQYYKERNPTKIVKSGYVPKNPKEFDKDAFLEQRYQNMCTKIDEFMGHIHGRYEGLKFFGLAIVKRSHWFPEIEIISARLNGYLNRQMKGRIEPSHLETDEIHFNANGYSHCISKGLGPLLDDYFMSIESPEKHKKVKKIIIYSFCDPGAYSKFDLSMPCIYICTSTGYVVPYYMIYLSSELL